MIDIALKRSAQSVLHGSGLPREEADRIGQQIADRLQVPETYNQAALHYGTLDPFELGEAAAQDYVRRLQTA